jgi:glutathione synthase/RimK-type ligase-like ATP-grasp enzyme
MIAIVSSPGDSHSAEVLHRVQSRGAKASVIDLSEFPRVAELSIDFAGAQRRARSRLVNRKETLDLGDCRVIWWRRPQPFAFHEEMTDATAFSFAYAEAHSAFSGLWLTLDAVWVNHPCRDEEAARKVYQLQVAQEEGLRIPETCITNSPQQARSFIERQGTRGTIYKAFSGTEEAWRETRLLKPGEMKELPSVRFAPVIFQEYVPADVDVRITIVGDRVFAAAIHSQETSYKVDFRMTMDQARVTPHTLPIDLAQRLLAYVSRLGLVYGAIDMRRTPDGDYVFLEINPAGQWLFVENRAGLPITDALVDFLVGHD